MAWIKSRRALKLGIIFGVLFAVVYVSALAVYANSGKSVTNSAPSQQTNGVEAQLDVINIDPLRREIAVRVALLPHGSFANDDGGFKQAMQVKYYFTTGESSVVTQEVQAGQLYSLNEMKFLTYGDFDIYPADRYRQVDSQGPELMQTIPIPIFELSLLDANGEVVPKQESGQIPIWVEEPTGAPHGWSATWNLASEDSLLFWDYSMKRAGGTLAFVVVVLIMMAVLAVAALSVSIRVFRKPGTIEATMASWQAALLFALVPLRNFLPGAPPIGAWIDMLVFYWVILALMVSMALFTYSWLRDRGHLPSEKTKPDEEAKPDEKEPATP